MKKSYIVQSFEMDNAILRFDPETSILLCQSASNGKKQWIKKLIDINAVTDIIEDNRNYYLACNSGEINGQFIAVLKNNGMTEWFIPGRSFLHVIYKNYIYLIFSDENSRFYFLKVSLKDGKSAWFHQVEQDLSEYEFLGDKIRLKYLSGKYELISVRTGENL